MANQIYGYNPSSYGGGGGGGGGSSLSSIYTSRSATDPYSLSDQRYIPSSGPFSSSSDSFDHSKYERAAASLYQTDALRYASTGTGITTAAGAYPGSRIFGADAAPSVSKPLTSWPGIDVGSTYDYEAVLAGMKRHNEAFYHQSVMGNHNSIGQSEALFSTNTLAKRPRLESATNLPVYPQRPGEKDCAHYMLTRTCKFGESCKFDHPIWVPEGGIPDWKEVPLVPSSESLPERPGVPDCPYFLKTQKCKFGFKCKFNHPKDKVVSLGDVETVDVSVLPERPSEPPCSFYVKTGKCKFGATCKFHHPKDIEVPQSNEEHGNGVQSEAAVKSDEITAGDATLKPFTPFTPASLHNSKGLPVRPGEVDCPFYLKTGSCKYGATCRYNHPDRSAINPSIAAGLNNAFISSPAANLNFGVINPAASFLPSMDPRLAQTTLGVSPTIFSQQPGVSPNIYPQRPGQMECDFYMKTGECKFGERCKFHHPLDRSAPTPSMTKQALQQNVKLTLAGLPRREGAIICPFYMKTATCKYGVTCRFDHPPPGEAIAMASAQGTSGTVGEQEGDKVAETTGEPQGTSELQFYN